ncbi:ribosomal RNA processing protein 36 homolog isoform X1 [Olea europaea var. sylvestris]|uniref:ribosomal RNA processing protein 36 homolog isoform X1 n=2 Tax=Olea europaea var. sylvestris TaxID=158386 RepID=UPI000C1D3545|nr:ribosomal RNA processing protein 36 homolog isoform X1 [Olea europaea var. sylvestris]
MKKPESAVATSNKIKFDDGDSHESSSEEEEEIERELADVTFEELLRARSDGSEMVYRKSNAEKKSSRANKNRPMEMSSKKPVSRFREVIQVPKRVGRDPRFESLCGKLDVEGFKKRYDFIQKNELPAEKEALKKKMKEEKDPEVINELKDRMVQIGRELKSAVTKHTNKEIIAEHKKKEREAAKKGKRPYYLKKSDIRKQKLIQKYEELKGTGKLESFLDKKRRKNAAKDHRYMPYRRPAEQ